MYAVLRDKEAVLSLRRRLICHDPRGIARHKTAAEKISSLRKNSKQDRVDDIALRC